MVQDLHAEARLATPESQKDNVDVRVRTGVMARRRGLADPANGATA